MIGQTNFLKVVFFGDNVIGVKIIRPEQVLNKKPEYIHQSFHYY
jgi:hypothetical protein